MYMSLTTLTFETIWDAVRWSATITVAFLMTNGFLFRARAFGLGLWLSLRLLFIPFHGYFVQQHSITWKYTRIINESAKELKNAFYHISLAYQKSDCHLHLHRSSVGGELSASFHQPGCSGMVELGMKWSHTCNTPLTVPCQLAVFCLLDVWVILYYKNTMKWGEFQNI